MDLSQWEIDRSNRSRRCERKGKYRDGGHDIISYSTGQVVDPRNLQPDLRWVNLFCKRFWSPCIETYYLPGSEIYRHVTDEQVCEVLRILEEYVRPYVRNNLLSTETYEIRNRSSGRNLDTAYVSVYEWLAWQNLVPEVPGETYERLDWKISDRSKPFVFVGCNFEDVAPMLATGGFFNVVDPDQLITENHTGQPCTYAAPTEKKDSAVWDFATAAFLLDNKHRDDSIEELRALEKAMKESGDAFVQTILMCQPITASIKASNKMSVKGTELIFPPGGLKIRAVRFHVGREPVEGMRICTQCCTGLSGMIDIAATSPDTIHMDAPDNSLRRVTRKLRVCKFGSPWNFPVEY